MIAIIFDHCLAVEHQPTNSLRVRKASGLHENNQLLIALIDGFELTLDYQRSACQKAYENLANKGFYAKS